MTVCTSCRAENRDEARFCDSCGAPLADAVATRELRKTVIVQKGDVLTANRVRTLLAPAASAGR